MLTTLTTQTPLIRFVITFKCNVVWALNSICHTLKHRLAVARSPAVPSTQLSHYRDRHEAPVHRLFSEVGVTSDIELRSSHRGR